MKVTPKILYFDGTSTVQPAERVDVIRYDWSNIGGPDSAELRVSSADSLPLWRYAEMLRYHVILNTSAGNPVWWGYVNRVELHIGNRVLTVSLDDMFNNVQIHYNNPGVSGVQAKTAYANYATSVTRYGYRDLMEQGTDISTQAAAEAKRDLILSIFRVPNVRRELLTISETENYAVLYCDGWYKTLSWQYYANAGTSSVETTTQIGSMVTASGQFITGTDIIDVSGISISEARDGNDKAKAIIEQLLEMGVSGGRSLRCQVSKDRRLTVLQEPANDNLRYYIDQDNQIRDGYGLRVPPEYCTVGVWVGDRSTLLPGGSETLADPGAFYVDSAEYDASTGLTHYWPRGSSRPLDVIRINRG